MLTEEHKQFADDMIKYFSDQQPLTLRDQFALAVAGVITTLYYQNKPDDYIAKEIWQLADAILAERDKAND